MSTVSAGQQQKRQLADAGDTVYGSEGCGSSPLARSRRDDEWADRDYAAFILDASPDEHRQRDRVYLI